MSHWDQDLSPVIQELVPIWNESRTVLLLILLTQIQN
jgi:hypothetical protein